MTPQGCADTAPPERPDAPEAPPETDLDTRIDAYLEPILLNRDFSGVILIGTRDSVLAQRIHGAADFESGEPNTMDTTFAIASLTKTFTAGATILLRDQGLLKLSDTLDRFGLKFPRAGDITVRHLLTHSSGLANPDYAEAFHTSLDHEELIGRITAQPLLFEPGSQHRYSNAGYNVLAWVIRQVSGVSYEEVLKREIFGPLGMTRTGHIDAASPPEVALGHVPGPGPEWRRRTPASDTGYSLGSGSLYSTAPDLLSWARAVADERLFMWRDLEWPYGWGKVEVGSHRGIEQTGAWTGFMSSLLVFPDDGLFVIVLHNQEYGGWIRMGQALAAIVFDERYDTPGRLSPIVLPTQGLSRYTGAYADENTTLDIVDEGGHLWLYNRGWPVGKYITPLSPTEFAVRSDVGRILFEEGATTFESLLWDFGDSSRRYRRVP